MRPCDLADGREHARGSVPGGDGVVQDGSAPRAAVSGRAASVRGPVTREDNEANRQGPASSLAAERLDWRALGPGKGVLPEVERPGIRMHVAGGVQHGVLGRIIGRARSDQLGDEPALAGHARPGQQDGLPAPADDARVDEDVPRRPLGDVKLEVGFEAIEQVVQ